MVARSLAQSERALVELLPAEAATGASTATATISKISLLTISHPLRDSQAEDSPCGPALPFERRKTPVSRTGRPGVHRDVPGWPQRLDGIVRTLPALSLVAAWEGEP